jgi:ParB family chromosome partitioning protein
MAKVTKKQRLGRGLSAILNDPAKSVEKASDKGAKAVVGNILEIPIGLIEVNPFQPRQKFDAEALQELATSIQSLGVIQPITVRKLAENKYQLVSGERRFRASKLNGMETIPAYIRLANDQEMLEMALVENIQRAELDPIEVALSYKQLIEQVDLTQEEMSKRVGKKRSTITNYLRLLKLHPIVQTGMRDGFLSMGHGRALINITDEDEQLDIYEQILRNKLSVRQTEELVKNFKAGNTDKPKKETIAVPEHIAQAKQTLTDYFGTNISIKVDKKGKGSISIPFYSDADFNRLKKLIQK